MKTRSPAKIWTDDALMALDRDGRKHELWLGKVVTRPPAGWEHGEVIMRHLIGNSVLPGWRLAVSKLFAGLGE